MACSTRSRTAASSCARAREAELELARKRARLEELDGSLELLARQGEQSAERLRGLDDDVRLALARGEDELARFAVRRVLALRRQLERGEALGRDRRDERAKLAAKLELQERELEALRDRVREALAEERARATHGCDIDPDGPAFAVRDEEVELELLRRRSAPVPS